MRLVAVVQMSLNATIEEHWTQVDWWASLGMSIVLFESLNRHLSFADAWENRIDHLVLPDDISSRSWERSMTSTMQSDVEETLLVPHVLSSIVVDHFILIMTMIDQLQMRRKTISLSIVWNGVIIGHDQSGKRIQIVLIVSRLRTTASIGHSMKSVRFIYSGTFNPFTFTLLKHVE